MSTRSRFDLRDLVLMALLAAIGGVLSTYVGYLGNLINRLFGVPFGAGQLIAGVHILWPLLARSIIRRFGAGTLTGLLKGVVEFLSGGTHGAIIVLVSLIEGVFVDVGMSMSARRSLALTMVAGAAASATNVFVFQAVYFSGIPVGLVMGMAALAALSGAFFGGYLTWDLHALLRAAHLVRSDRQDIPATGSIRWRRYLVSLSVLLVGLAGAVYYVVDVADPFTAAGDVRIGGDVSAPYVYRFDTLAADTVTVHAELRGSTVTIPARDYTGHLLRDIVSCAQPLDTATTVSVVAADGYEVAFALADVDSDDGLLLSGDDDGVRLVAAGYDGAMWVRQVRRLVIR